MVDTRIGYDLRLRFTRGKVDLKARRDHELRSEEKQRLSEDVLPAGRSIAMEETARPSPTSALSLNSCHMLEEACFEFAGIDPSRDEHDT